MRKVLSKEWLWIILLIALGAVVLWPLSRRGFFVSDDGEWMIIRLSAFFQNLREGQFPVRFLGRLNHSYGYPVANFLYPGFLYLGSVIHALGFGFVDSVKIIFAISVIGTAFFIFLWLRRQFSLVPSFVGTIGFIFSPYVLFDLYRRGSVGEMLAFFPATVGLYALASNKRFLFALALGSLVISHNTLAMLFTGFYLLWLLWHKNSRFFLSFALGLGLSGFFWLPALFERRFVIFDLLAVSRPADYFINSHNISLLGFVGFVAAIILLVKHTGKTVKGWVFYISLFIISSLLATTVSAEIWNWQPLVRLVQFPFRFLALSVVTSSWIIAAVVETAHKGQRAGLLVLFGILWLGSALSALRKIEYTFHPETFYTTNEATTNVMDEYMPRWVSVKSTNRPATKVELVNGDATVKLSTVNSQKIVGEIIAAEDSVIQINTIYYPGWGVALDNASAPIDYHNPRGLMRIRVPSGKHTMFADFRETPARLTADFVSLASLVALCIFAIRERRRS